MAGNTFFTSDLFVTCILTSVLTYFFLKFLNFLYRTVQSVRREYVEIKLHLVNISHQFSHLNMTMATLHNSGLHSLNEVNNSLRNLSSSASTMNIMNAVFNVVKGLFSAYLSSTLENMTRKSFDCPCFDSQFTEEPMPMSEPASEPTPMSHQAPEPSAKSDNLVVNSLANSFLNSILKSAMTSSTQNKSTPVTDFTSLFANLGNGLSGTVVVGELFPKKSEATVAPQPSEQVPDEVRNNDDVDSDTESESENPHVTEQS